MVRTRKEHYVYVDTPFEVSLKGANTPEKDSLDVPKDIPFKFYRLSIIEDGLVTGGVFNTNVNTKKYKFKSSKYITGYYDTELHKIFFEKSLHSTTTKLEIVITCRVPK